MRYALPIAAIAASLALTLPAGAQFYSTYVCRDGARFAMALFDDYVSLNLDGKLIHVPQRAASKGQRYSTHGIRISVDGPNVTLTRNRRTTRCTVESRVG